MPGRHAPDGDRRSHHAAASQPADSAVPPRLRKPADQPRPRADLGEITLQRVVAASESRLWNEWIARYHYLGYCPLPGAQLRYFAHADGRLLAALGFSAAAWSLAPRDRFIGWTVAERQAHLHLVVGPLRHASQQALDTTPHPGHRTAPRRPMARG